MLTLEYLEGTYNPVGRPGIFDDPTSWTSLQLEMVVLVANAKFERFLDVAEYIAGLVRQGLVTKQDAVDLLHEVALYNALYVEYGRDRIHSIIATPFRSEVA
ncbi:hypothetical protein AB7783_19995 [Tardiphaga sp. 172_B4_N1_3]|uniref:hypothetical protein n=1 Tax=Tardiphaga sp. 172_B4_N1_3 TaxID=3240787 RepID=UPI003F8A9437